MDLSYCSRAVCTPEHHHGSSCRLCSVTFASTPIPCWAAELKARKDLSARTISMEQIADEATYVLGVLYQMREKVIATPHLFDADAVKLIEAEIAAYEGLKQELGAA